MFVFVTGMTEVGNLQDVEAPSPLIEDYPLYKTEDLVSLCLPRMLFFPLLRTPEPSNMIHSRLSFPAPGVDLSLQERLDKLFPDDGPKVKNIAKGTTDPRIEFILLK